MVFESANFVLNTATIPIQQTLAQTFSFIRAKLFIAVFRCVPILLGGATTSLTNLAVVLE